jgi:hypothetical protein
MIAGIPDHIPFYIECRVASPLEQGERIEVRGRVTCTRQRSRNNPHLPPLPYEGRGDPKASSAFHPLSRSKTEQFRNSTK